MPELRRRREGTDVNRPGTVARGYGPVHKRLRAAWAALVEAGQVWCARCGKWIEPGTPWDLGHDDNDRSLYTGPEHRACNTAAAARKTHAIRRRKAQARQTMWTRW
jgi:hypothetical protein